METVTNDYSVVSGLDISSFHPRPHHILVRWPGKRESKSGILYPESRMRLGLMKGYVLSVGPDCDPRLSPGKTIQFSFNTEKEFLGPQSPGDRDPVFFMREEDVLGITWVDGVDDHVCIQLLMGTVLIRPDKAPEEIGGLINANVDKIERTCSGVVIQTDANERYEYEVGDRVWYKRSVVEELQLGGLAEGNETLHVLRTKFGCDVLAIRED